MSTYSAILAHATVLAHTLLIALLVLRCLPSESTDRIRAGIEGVLRKRGLILACGIAVAATAAPLIYTHVYHLTPCVLCWYQRICMFPIAAMLILACLRKDLSCKIYIYLLAFIGLGVSTYHYIVQQVQMRLHVTLGDCDAINGAGRCADYYLLEFGYITMPMMAMTAFALILCCVYFAGRQQ